MERNFVAQFKVGLLSRYLFGTTEENHKMTIRIASLRDQGLNSEPP
jgi:hypothetical protein